MSAAEITAEQLLGTWKLLSATGVDADGRPLPPPFGPIPMGRLVLHENGRMMAVMCDGRNVMPDGEERGYASYCGNFRVENNTLITTVDAALERDRIGGEQRRELEFRDGKLILRPPPRPDGERREILWELAGPA